MKLSELTKKPVLTKFMLDDEDTVKEFGESLEFYTLQPFPLDVFMKFQMRDMTDTKNLMKETIDVLSEVILNEDGTQVMSDGKVLPVVVLLRVITKLTTELGK